MKIKLMIAAVIACLVFTGFTKENVSDTVDHNAWKTSGVVVTVSYTHLTLPTKRIV